MRDRRQIIIKIHTVRLSWMHCHRYEAHCNLQYFRYACMYVCLLLLLLVLLRIFYSHFDQLIPRITLKHISFAPYWKALGASNRKHFADVFLWPRVYTIHRYKYMYRISYLVCNMHVRVYNVHRVKSTWAYLERKIYMWMIAHWSERERKREHEHEHDEGRQMYT